MQFTTALFGLVAAASTAYAQAGEIVQVTVGAGGNLRFVPNDIIAQPGTQVQFSFFPKNHTVTQSSFADPCHPLAAGGFFSGFNPTANSPSGTTFTITVNDTKPIWFYCGQTKGNHCQMGMVGSINAPRTGNTLAAFTALASNATLSTNPPFAPVGGVVAQNGNSTYSSTAVTTSAWTSYAYSTYTSNGATYTSTLATQTVVITETAVIGGGATATSSSAPATQTTNAANGITGNMFGAAAVAFGALAMI